MFHPTGHRARVDIPRLSLEDRIGLVRRRRRTRMLKDLVLFIGPVLGGVVFILLLAAGGATSASAR